MSPTDGGTAVQTISIFPEFRSLFFYGGTECSHKFQECQSLNTSAAEIFFFLFDMNQLFLLFS